MSAAPKPSTAKIRPLRADDSVEEITHLLHRAYARNAAVGLRFVATHQTPSVTAERLTKGLSFVAEIEGQIVGTVTVQLDCERPYGEYEPGHPIASMGQFAVDPAHSGLGIGDLLLVEVERVVSESGGSQLALDTAQGATSLIAYYESHGFRIVARADWRPETNYESWIMTKNLSRSRENPPNATVGSC